MMISNASRRDFGFRLGNIKTSVGIPDVHYTTYSRDSRSRLVVRIPYGIAEARKSAVMAFHVDLVNTMGAKKANPGTKRHLIQFQVYEKTATSLAVRFRVLYGPLFLITNIHKPP